MQDSKDSVQRRLNDANELIARGKYESAVIHLQKAIFLCPEDPDLYIARGDAYLGVYDISSAIQNYRRADKLEQGSEKRVPGAALSSTGLKLADLHATYCRRLLSAQRYDSAEAQANFAISLRPFHAPFHVLLVLAQSGANKWDEALDGIRSMLEADPRQPELYVLRCRINIERKCLEQVVDDMTRLVRLAPEHPEVVALSEGMHAWTEQLVAKSMENVIRERYDDALALLDRSLNLRPGDSDLLYKRGIAQRLAGRLEDAMKDMEDALEAASGNYPEAARQLRILHNEMGVQYHGWDLYPEAIEQFDLAIRGQVGSEDIDEAMAMVYANRGDCYQLLGSDDKALQDYELCIHQLDLIKKDAGGVNEEAYSRVARKCGESLFNRGRLAVTFGEYSRAATFFTKAIDMCPDVVEFSFQRAEILGRLEMYKQQKEDLERVLTLDPRHARARTLLQRVSPHHSLVLGAGVSGLNS